MEINEALRMLRKQKNDPNSPAHFMYTLLSEAHPTVVAMIERQCAHAIIAGQNVVETITEASKTTEGREEIRKQMEALKTSAATGVSPEAEKEDDLDVS